jgi:hypothetical protein
MVNRLSSDFRAMGKIVKSKIADGQVVTLILHDADVALLEFLRAKRRGKVDFTISAASANEEVILITQNGRVHECKREDVFKDSATA